MKKIKLTDQQRKWLVSNYAHTKNQELAAHLGVSLRSVERMAQVLCLRKSDEYMSALRRARALNLLKCGFKPGENLKSRMSAEAWIAMHRRIGEHRKETVRRERIRVNWGFEQKTNLRVVRCPLEKVYMRHKLRQHGYELGRRSNDAIITSSTRRSIKMESRAQKMGIRFYHQSIGES